MFAYLVFSALSILSYSLMREILPPLAALSRISCTPMYRSQGISLSNLSRAAHHNLHIVLCRISYIYCTDAVANFFLRFLQPFLAARRRPSVVSFLLVIAAPIRPASRVSMQYIVAYIGKSATPHLSTPPRLTHARPRAILFSRVQREAPARQHILSPPLASPRYALVAGD